METASTGRRCSIAGCAGRIGPFSGDALPAPKLWLRLHDDGQWWVSRVKPMPEFGERNGTRWYRCDVCEATILSVVGGPHCSEVCRLA